MMGSIRPGVRGGLLELFYAVYERNAESCLTALTTMGVLVPGGEVTAVRRTAQFFLNSLDERLQIQKQERETRGEEYSAQFKPQRSKEESKAKRKAILSNIGEDLLSVSKDQPFRFPATFTFVVRAFSVLDGLGKSLDPRFDISEISAPYARELLIEASSVALPPQLVARQRDLARRAARQNRAFVNLFQGPDRIQEMDAILKRIDSGAFKPRVRALEVERAVERLRAQNGLVLRSLLACTSLNAGLVLSVAASASVAPLAVNACFALAALSGLSSLSAALKLKKLDASEARLSPSAA
jgi:predicted unusual protein kinase regulating ubiquinone biosynthesis (AarF/ABC1/UbiB family)